MKHLNKLILTAALAMASISGSLSADTFDFSYTFEGAYGGPGSFSGTLTGSYAGNFVSGVAVESLYVNGDQVLGTIYLAKYDAFLGQFVDSGSPVVSFSKDLNNFIFGNSDFGAGDGSGDGYAYLVNASGIGAAYAQNLSALSFGSFDEGNGVWSLTHRPAVPEGGLTAGLLGLALLGFAAVRRQAAR